MLKNINSHRGSDFDDYFEEEGLYDEVNARAAKKLLAWQLLQALDETGLIKTELAARMRTSRAAVNCLSTLTTFLSVYRRLIKPPTPWANARISNEPQHP